MSSCLACELIYSLKNADISNMGNAYSLTYQKITQRLYNPKASVIDLAAVVLQDPFLTERLLNIAHSRYYNLPERIESVTGAIIVLGFDVVEAIINDHFLSSQKTPKISP